MQTQTPDDDGVLGGYGHVTDVDLECSEVLSVVTLECLQDPQHDPSKLNPCRNLAPNRDFPPTIFSPAPTEGVHSRSVGQI